MCHEVVPELKLDPIKPSVGTRRVALKMRVIRH